MARQSGIAVQNNFSKGLVTEATGLNFPPDAATETYNCVFDPSGFFERRRGINYEIDPSFQTLLLGQDVCTEFVWLNVAGLASLSFVVVQVADRLRFYSVTADESLSSGLKSFTVDIDSFRVMPSPSPNRLPCQFANGNGYLFVVHPYCDPFYISYDPDTDTIDTTRIEIEIRDFEGVDDGLRVDQRPTTLSDEHKYNLYNQGWYLPSVEADGANGNPVTLWDNARSDFPSNADVWWYFKQVDAATGEEFFNPSSNVDNKAMGNTAAPKGHYILPAFDTDRSSQSGIGTVTEETSRFYRPSTVAFFAGRIWYAGVNYEQYSSRIYFSQIITNDQQVGKCYQANDPTSEDFSDLLPTDGGVISSPEIGTVYKIFPLEYSLVIFASNGIWAISGSEGVGFRANDYSLRKVSSLPSISPFSFVDVDGIPMWWNLQGIYMLGPDQVGDIKVQSLSDTTIKTFFNEIPPENRKYAKGVYDRTNNRVQWVYRSQDTENNYHQYDRVLNFNVLNGSWFPWSVSLATARIAGAVAIQGSGATLEDQDGEIVAVAREFPSVIKYLVFNADGQFSFAESYDISYMDFDTHTYESYVVTGYAVEGQAAIYFQAPWIMPYLDTTTADTAIDLYARWNYSNSGDTGKWSSVQRIEFGEELYNYKTKRVKARGRGRALQIMIRSVSQRPFKCIGWSLVVTSNASP